MKAVILSAGKGTRMMPLTANTPKCLIDIGQGKTLLESQLDVLRACGFKEVYIVAGYRIEQVEAKIAGYCDDGMKTKVIHNPFYATSNNIISLWLALPYVGGEFISINGDDIFKESVIEALLAADGDIAMTIDCKEAYDADDMLVVMEGSLVRRVGKDLDRALANGESVGIIRYRDRGVSMLEEALNLMLREEENHQRFYLAALQHIMDLGFPVFACEVDSTDWAEIDFHPDVQELRAKVDSFLRRMR
jgi:choline kinase